MLVTLILFLVSPAPAQRVEIGGILGWSPSTDFQPRRVNPDGPLSFSLPYESESGSMVSGPTFAVRVQPRLYLSLDMLYRPMGYRFLSPGAGSSVVEGPTTYVNAWQFPVLARYHLTGGSMQPFLEAGPSFRTGDRGSVASPSGVGFTAGAGVQFPSRGLAIAPRLRYTRWASDPSNALIRANQDQIDLLVGFTFHGEEDPKPLGRRFSLGAMVGTYLGSQQESITLQDTNPFGPGSVTIPRNFEPRRFLIGPVFQLQITPRISAEVSALIRSFRTEEILEVRDAAGALQQSVQVLRTGPYARWEVPLLGRYHFGDVDMRPFVVAGVSLREGRSHAFARGSRGGFTTGAGVEMPWKALRFAPQLRYTRWGSGPTQLPSFVQLPRDELHLLVSTTF